MTLINKIIILIIWASNFRQRHHQVTMNTIILQQMKPDCAALVIS